MTQSKKLINPIESTNEWVKDHVDFFNIKVVNLNSKFFTNGGNNCRDLIIHEWEDESWFINKDFKNTKYDYDKTNAFSNDKQINNNIRALLIKLQKISKNKKDPVHIIEPYMNQLLNILGFDSFPLIGQKEFKFNLNDDNIATSITAQVDFGIINFTNQSIFFIVEDKNNSSCDYWDESQIFGNIFTTLFTEDDNAIEINTVYAIRVVANIFIFYKSIMTSTYKTAIKNKNYKAEKLIIYRYIRSQTNEDIESSVGLNIYKCLDRTRILRQLTELLIEMGGKYFYDEDKKLIDTRKGNIKPGPRA